MLIEILLLSDALIYRFLTNRCQGFFALCNNRRNILRPENPLSEELERSSQKFLDNYFLSVKNASISNPIEVSEVKSIQSLTIPQTIRSAIELMNTIFQSYW